MGFDYFYGFIGGDTSQWQPNLFRNTTQIYPYVGRPGWNLTTAEADDAIDWLARMDQIDPAQAVFLLLRARRHPRAAPCDARVDRADQPTCTCSTRAGTSCAIRSSPIRSGWAWFRRRKMTPWPDKLLKHWDQLTADEKKLFIRQVDVYAAYLAYTDHEIGRVIQAVEDLGKLDNTLIIYISGDNGSSAEGSLIGTPNEVASFNGVQFPVADQLKYFYNAWGSDRTYNHMAVPWTWAFDTPFSWTKQIASHFGGTRQGVCVSWPGHIKDRGGIRHQFHHVIDVVPTILECCRSAAARICGRHPAEPRSRASASPTRSTRRTPPPRRAPHAVFRDDGRPRHLPRRLDRQHESHPPALGGLRPGQPGPAEQLHLGALRPEQRLDARRGRGGKVSRQGGQR